jgi:hypothetical protein
MTFGGATMPTPREWVRICELEKAAIEHQSVEKWIEIDRKLDPNWTEEKSKAPVSTQRRVAKRLH